METTPKYGTATFTIEQLDATIAEYERQTAALILTRGVLLHQRAIQEQQAAAQAQREAETPSERAPWPPPKPVEPVETGDWRPPGEPSSPANKICPGCPKSKGAQPLSAFGTDKSRADHKARLCLICNRKRDKNQRAAAKTANRKGKKK